MKLQKSPLTALFVTDHLDGGGVMDEEVVGDGDHGQHVHAEEDAAESAHHRHVEHVHIHVSAHGANTLKDIC